MAAKPSTTEHMPKTQKEQPVHRVPINTNRAPSRRMRPVIDILLNESVSISEAAERIGMSRSSVSRWLTVDDARLSSLEELGKALGYHLEWKFVKD